MTYEKNLTGWTQAAKDKNISVKYGVKLSRMESIKKLISSGLPTYEYHFRTLEEFLDNPSDIKEIYSKYNNSIVVRILGEKDDKKRYTFIDKSYESIHSEVKEQIQDTKEYKVILNEYDPAEYVGVIISKDGEATIEMTEDSNLEKLCHGEIIPWSASFREKNGRKRIEFENVKEQKIRDVMWRSLGKILLQKDSEGTYPEYEPQSGYYEFVISKKTGKTLFIDYNEI